MEPRPMPDPEPDPVPSDPARAPEGAAGEPAPAREPPLDPELPPELASSLDPVPDLGESILLVRRAQGGDAAALDELLARYYDRIHRIARIRLGARLRRVMDSLDIVQQTCAVAVRKLPGFEVRDHASLIQWLAKIAENQIRDAADRYGPNGKRDLGREVPLDARPGEGSEVRPGLRICDGGPSPSSIAANAELKEIYDACVESLPEDYRELILLREYAGASWEEACQKLGRPNVHATQEMYRRAQIKLAGCLRRRLGR